MNALEKRPTAFGLRLGGGYGSGRTPGLERRDLGEELVLLVRDREDAAEEDPARDSQGRGQDRPAAEPVRLDPESPDMAQEPSTARATVCIAATERAEARGDEARGQEELEHVRGDVEHVEQKGHGHVEAAEERHEPGEGQPRIVDEANVGVGEPAREQDEAQGQELARVRGTMTSGRRSAREPAGVWRRSRAGDVR